MTVRAESVGTADGSLRAVFVQHRLIAGLPSLTETQAIAFFQDGKRPDGTTPLPPMPAFRFDAADAAAVTAYLKSLAR